MMMHEEYICVRIIVKTKKSLQNIVKILEKSIQGIIGITLEIEKSNKQKWGVIAPHNINNVSGEDYVRNRKLCQ